MKSGTAVAVFVLVVVMAAGVVAGYTVLSTNRSATTATTNPSSLSTGSQTHSQTWSIIKSNLTVYYGAACVPVEFSYLSCPTEDVASHSPSLTGVDLIRYLGNYYYDTNFTYYMVDQPITRTIWFTNSSVFCASPVEANSGVGLCPATPQRSGPISTYPAAWSIYSSCPGFSNTGNTTTLTDGLPTTYPNLWNTTTVVTLSQVYQDIVSSSDFATIASGHGWVVFSWDFIQGGSTNMPPGSNDIVGYFILTSATSPDGYVTAYYNIQNGSVAVGSLTTTVTIACSMTITSSTTSSARSQTSTSTTAVKATSFTYTPTGQVQVDSVWATETPAQNGKQNVTFWVDFENIGSSPVYAIEWWIGMMSSNVTGSSSVLRSVPSMRCAGAIQLATLNHGQNLTIHTPDCGSGFNYQLVHAGSVTAVLSFGWSTSAQETTPFSNSTTISANFTFS